MPIPRKARMALAVMTIFGATSTLYVTSGQADTSDCPTETHVDGSQFEVDTSGGTGVANLTVDGGANCIDWLKADGTTFRSRVLAKGDDSGSKDNSFGKGTSENDTPTIVTGSIPPNKSNLTKFGVFTEPGGSGGYLALFWARANQPSGTTNMDFELNRNYCDPGDATHKDCADNGKGNWVTPVRTEGDKLISYDLSNGGTNPLISIRNWTGSTWSSAEVISGGANPNAKGSVNATAIAVGAAGDASAGLGALDPFTFGEAVISFQALFGESCGSFGSAFLKSRSSDSFSAEIKDFVAPEKATISNCLATVSTEQFFYPNDSVTVSASDGNPQGKVTFELFKASDTTCTTALYTQADVLLDSAGKAETNNTTFRVTDSATYQWKVSYNGGGDNKHDPVPGSCDGPESFTITAQKG